MVPEVGRALTEGVRLFNRGEFFACHEVWEDAWRPSAPPLRLFLQSLIHVAVSLHHETCGNPEGARLQMRKALRKLAAYLPAYEGVDTGRLYRHCAGRRPDEALPGIAFLPAALRLVRPSDVDEIYRLLSDMNVVRYMSFPLHTREDAERYAREPRPCVLGPQRYAIDRAIVTAGREEMAGLCGLVVDQEREEAEAWYMIAPERQGRGLATSAMRLLLRTGFEALGLHRVWACVVPANAASARVLEKAGLRAEGRSLQNLKIHGQWCDSLLYAMLREEWESAPRSEDCSPRTA